MNCLIFLDIDGVLNTFTSRTDAHPHCVDNLNSLIATTGADIVVSSAWRKMGLFKIRDVLRRWGVRGSITGLTPVLDRQLEGDIWLSPGRGAEISAYLDQLEFLDLRYVILDDEVHGMGEHLSKCVQTNYEVGLTEDDVSIAIDILTPEPVILGPQ